MTAPTSTTDRPLERYVRETLNRSEIKVADLTDEQRARALEAPKQKGGLRGKALKDWIMDATTGQEAIDADRSERRSAERSEATRQHITKSKDPEAAAISVKAKEFAGVKSPFSPSEGRVFLDQYEVAVEGEALRVRHALVEGIADDGHLREVILPRAAVEGFAKGSLTDEDAKREVRQAMSGLGKGTVLWGRKLAALISVKAAG